MIIFKIITILGIVAYSMVVITVVNGLLRKKFEYKKWSKIHLVFAIITLILASTHAILVLINY